MKKIKTTDIVTGASYPFSKKGLDFLQQSYQEVLANLAQTFISDAPSTTIGYILYGCVKTLISGSNYSLTAGAIYFNGEVYAVDAIASISIATAPIMTITTTNDPTADPTEFTDGSSKNVHNIRKMVLSDGVLGAGTLNFVDLRYKSEDWISGGGGGQAKYRKAPDGYVHLIGALGIGVSSFTIPVGYRPSTNQSFSVLDETGTARTVDINASTGNVSFSGGTRVSISGISYRAEQ